MKLLDKPGSIKPTKKGDMEGQNDNHDQLIEQDVPISCEFEQNNQDKEQENESNTDFDLSINNIELQRLYNFPNSDIQCANQLNKWLKEQTLYWNIQGQQVQFNFPEHLLSSHEEQPLEIMPQSVIYKPNSLFSLSVQINNTTKESSNQQGKHIQKEPPKPVQQKVYDPLNKTQLGDIWDTSMFTVHYGYGEPEMWMIRPWVFYGKKRCDQFIKDTFEYAKQQFLQIKRRFYTEQTVNLILKNQKNHQVNSENCECVCLDINMLEGLRVILGIPIHLIILLIGIPLYDVDAEKLENVKIKVVQNRIEKEIFGERMGKYTDIAFLQHFQENKGIYLGLDINFNEETEMVQVLKMIAEGKLQLDSTNKELVKLEIQDKIYENLIKKVCATLANNHNVNTQVLTSLENTFKAFVVCQRQIVLGEAGFPNFGKSHNILKELQKHKLSKQENLVSVFFNELKRGFGFLEERHIRNSIKVVSKKNHQEYTRSIPKVIHEVIDGRNVYSEVQKREIQIPTSFFFWKVIYLLVSSYLRIQHFIDFFLYMAFYSPCGLKSAIYSNPFFGSFKVNPNTGKFEGVHGSEIMPVTRIYQEIKEEALENIQKFEDEPDHGLLGKSITRICNRLDNWVFRTFLIGFVLVNICLRVCFIVIGLVSLVLVPLSFVLAPIYSMFCMVVCLICYDFTVPLRHIEWDLPVFAPLFDLLIWRLFGRGIGQILLSVIMIGFHIVSGVILIVFGIVIYIARRLIDFSVFIFIYSCGRVPGGDSYIAWRVTRQQRQYLSNDNISQQKKYSNSKQNSTEQPTIMDQLTQEQIHQLVDAEFDRQTLDIYRAEMYTKINEPVIQNDTKIRKLLQYLPFEFTQNKLSQEYHTSSQKLRQALNDQILSRKKNLPAITKRGHPNFIYKREAILNMFYLLQTYLAHKYGRHPFYSKFMWKNQQCEVGQYDNLALNFLSLIFFDKKVPPSQVIDKLTLKESQNKQTQVKQQIEDFFEQHYGSLTNRFIEPPQLLLFQQFIAKVLKRQDPKQPLVVLRSLNLNNLEEFIILNAILLNPDNIIHQNQPRK